MSDKETGASASGLFKFLSEKFNLGPKKQGEALVVPPAVPALEPTPTTMAFPGPTATEVPTPTADTAMPTPSVAEYPDWLIPPDQTAETYKFPDRIKQVIAEAPAPMPAAVAPDVLKYLDEQEAKLVAGWSPFPAPEVPAPLPAAETPAVEAPAPMAAAEVKVEDDPFATNREFNGYMEIIRQTQEVLARGIALTSDEQKSALIAVARSNSLLPKLPPEVFKSVLLMRAVASGNPKFGRDDFQREMLAAMDRIKTGVAVKG